MTASTSTPAPIAAPPDPVGGVCLGMVDDSGWRTLTRRDGALHVKGVLFGGDAAADALLRALGAGGSDDAVTDALAAIDGHFALVARAGGRAVAAVDRVRGYPLIWSARPDGTVWLDDRGDRTEQALGLSAADVDSDAALAVALAGFTIGDATLYRGVRQIGPGCALLVAAGTAARSLRYHRYDPWIVGDIGDGRTAIDAAADVTLAVLRKAAGSIGDRPVLVPLSAGRDSRLIAAGLRHVGVRDIRCFAYGLPGNHEAETSRRIAERLGLPWAFVPYGNRLLRDVQTSADYSAFVAASDSLTGVHFPQDHAAVRALERRGLVPADTVIVNGQTGDFITGNHVPGSLFEPVPGATKPRRLDTVLDALIAKHFKQWAFLADPDRLARVRTALTAEIAAIGGVPDDPAGDHGLYEWSEFEDRQSKYVVNGQRLYDHLGYDWRLPLWDSAYLDFWARVPLRHKRRQRLYADMLVATDWGGVWRDVPVNAKTIRPRWMIPLRFAAKAAHVPFMLTGRDRAMARWHRFERKVVDYWTGNLHAAAFVPYTRVLRDRRGAWGPIAWHIEAYLAGKGIHLADLAGAGRAGAESRGARQ